MNYQIKIVIAYREDPIDVIMFVSNWDNVSGNQIGLHRENCIGKSISVSGAGNSEALE